MLNFLYSNHITYNKIHKNCNKLPNNINKWNIECAYLCFFPTPYKTAPIVYAMPPDNNNINPGIPKSSGNKLIFTMIHHPIIK